MSDIITDVEAYRLLLRQLGEAQAELERLRANFDEMASKWKKSNARTLQLITERDELLAAWEEFTKQTRGSMTGRELSAFARMDQAVRLVARAEGGK
jgi:hypothetical protein